MATLKISSDLQNVIKNVVLDTYYPVGKIYITVGNENPNETIGGTWIKFGSGKCLVGVDTSQTEFNVSEKTGGEKTNTLKIEEMPKHTHTLYYYGTEGTYNPPYTAKVENSTPGEVTYGTNVPTTYSGDNQPHNNLQPYITVYMWKRTA